MSRGAGHGAGDAGNQCADFALCASGEEAHRSPRDIIRETFGLVEPQPTDGVERGRQAAQPEL